jgi:hypothetical protein
MPESEIIVVTANRATLEAVILTRRRWFVLIVWSERRVVARARVLSMRPMRRVGAVTAEIEAKDWLRVSSLCGSAGGFGGGGGGVARALEELALARLNHDMLNPIYGGTLDV